MDPPPSALRGSSRFVGEGPPLRAPRNPQASERYHASGYTSCRPSPPRQMTPRERVAAAYDQHYDALRYVAERQFRVPSSDSESLIHDVFVRFMHHHASISDDGGWLVTSIRNACLNYWRDRKPTGELPPCLPDVFTHPDVHVDLVRLLGRITARCRNVLWLRYVDGLTPEEIAQTCAASPSRGYGRQLIHRCLTAARAALSKPRGNA